MFSIRILRLVQVVRCYVGVNRNMLNYVNVNDIEVL